MEFFKVIEIPVTWVLVAFHKALTFLGMSPDSGWTWALSIVGLVVFIRILLVPLFVKQIKATRAMQVLAPDLRKIQQKYKGKKDQASREAMTRETMALYSKHKTNPFASCLPILVQAPIFFALFRVLNYHLRPQNEAAIRAANDAVAAGTGSPADVPAPVFESFGGLSADLVESAFNASFFGARLSDTFLGSDLPAVKILAAVLIVAMVATTFLTQRQLMRKNMPAAALTGPQAQTQKIMMYALPFIFVFSGPIFPIGVLIYWTTTNLWTMGQQFYVIRRNPTPGSQAEKALKERQAAKAARKAAARGEVLAPEPEEQKPVGGQRQQPSRKKRKRH